MRVAVIGAGIAGLACARSLAEAGSQVTIFDKGRRVGGRVSTRRQAGHQFDHGAQFFTVRSSAFRDLVAAERERGILARWEPRREDGDGRERIVGVGSMRAWPEAMAQGLDVRLETRVAPLEPTGAPAHHLVDEQRRPLGTFDRVVVTAPLAQAETLLGAFPSVSRQLSAGRHAPCWAVLVAFDRALPTDLDVLDGQEGPLSWAARDASKPARPDDESWVLHGSPELSEARLEATPEEVAEVLLAELRQRLGKVPRPRFWTAHRWRYAKVTRALDRACIVDEEGGIAVCGDGLLGPRVEAAWQSGRAAGRALLGQQKEGE